MNLCRASRFWLTLSSLHSAAAATAAAVRRVSLTGHKIVREYLEEGKEKKEDERKLTVQEEPQNSG